jgi:hypothetical protein
MTALSLNLFTKWGLDFIGSMKLMGRYTGNKYILVRHIMPPNQWKQGHYDPTW